MPSYYREHSGFLIAAAIDKYVYITLHETFVARADHQVFQAGTRRLGSRRSQHPIIREALRLMGMQTGTAWKSPRMADIPAGTGLGSSGSFTTALLKACTCARRTWSTRANWPSRPARSRSTGLSEPIGKQDQYIAAYGGITCFHFLPDGKVEAWPLKVSDETLYNLEDNLLLFFTGYSRSASAILKEQDSKSRSRTTAR